jgi:hypothetical protein
MSAFRSLNQTEIKTLEQAGCTASDWATVQVAEGFDPRRVREVAFVGAVTIGALSGSVSLEGGVSLPAELRHATIVNCQVGSNVRISNVGGHLANYIIEDGAVISDIGTMATAPGATFGNGVALETVNEGGGREVKMYSELSSQVAYMQAMHRYRPGFIKKLDAMVDAAVARVKSDKGRVGAGAVIQHVPEILDVNIGPFACVVGAARLKNGTILSEKAAPTKVGTAVVADDFIIAEGSSVDSGAVLGKTFIGQGVKCGKQFSAENSLFFANSECFHSESCSAFGGPYTVTHHRSSLLIAAVYSFYNAGSGTNASNHMYKLGPVHQGILERGSKTGSFSYVLWPCHVGPFSVIIGKNMANFDVSDFPFSYISAEEGGSYMTPSMNLFTVGTTRDGEKWPARDRRKATVKRDLIRFEVFSPYVVGKMVRGEKKLTEVYESTDKEHSEVRLNGVRVKRLLLRTGAKNYNTAIDRYLNERIVSKLEAAAAEGAAAVKKAAAVDATAVDSDAWADLSGLLLSQARLNKIQADVESGKLATIEQLQGALTEAWQSYEKDEWAWVRRVAEARFGRSLETLTKEDIAAMKASAIKARATFSKMILADAQKEFDEVAKIGYGADANGVSRDEDFSAVRGTFDGNSFVKKMKNEAGVS